MASKKNACFRSLCRGLLLLTVAACDEERQADRLEAEVGAESDTMAVTTAVSRFGRVSAGADGRLKIDADRFLQDAEELTRADFDPFDNWPSRETYIVKGENTFLYASAGALLKGTPVSDATIECSGTMIGCQTFLTAYHCVENDLTAANYHVYLQTHGIVGVAGISGQAQTGGVTGDLVVLELDYPVEQVNPVALNVSQPLIEGQTGRIVGFGHTGRLFNDHGIKRTGEIETKPCVPLDDSLICWQYSESEELASTCHVDSGGPLYFQDDAEQAVLAGVTSAVDAQCSDETQSVDVNVNYFADWIASAGGSDVAQPGPR